MVVRTSIHAPDGDSVTGSLSQEVSGDVTTVQCDVNCGECLDALGRSDRSFEQLAQPLNELRSYLECRALLR